MDKKRIAIVTDSTSDLPASLANENNISIVPITVVVDGQSMDDGDSEGSSTKRIVREQFYAQMPEMKVFPTTAAPAPIIFQRIYERLFDQGYEYIVSIILSSELSATYNSALMAAEPFGKRLHVMDSRQVSMGLGFEVLEAVDLFTQLEQEHPQADLSDLIPAKLAELKQTLSRLRVVALLDTMEYLRRSGRVSWAQAALGGLLDVKLIVGVQDGKVNRLAQARKRRNGIERVLEQVHSMGKLKRLGIMHTGVEGDEIRQMLDEFSPQLETRPQSTQPALPLIDWITPVVGAHIGTNALAIAALAWDEFSS